MGPKHPKSPVTKERMQKSLKTSKLILLRVYINPTTMYSMILCVIHLSSSKKYVKEHFQGFSTLVTLTSI